MLIRVGYDITLQLPEPAAMLLLLSIHPSRAATIRQPERLEVTPYAKISEFTDTFGNRCSRVFVPAGQVMLHNTAVVEDTGQPDPQVWDAIQHLVSDVPDDAMQFLLPSRYCEVDSALKDIAWNLAGTMVSGWLRVQAICTFVYQHVRFDYLAARANRTALETFHERVGVCRDFVHLAITLCRCLNIPARYCTGYLGDIGLPAVPTPAPMDFSAWFEVFVGGRWHVFDPRHNAPRIGRVLMARGRDAADAALMTSFGAHQLVSFTVWTDEVSVARGPGS